MAKIAVLATKIPLDLKQIMDKVCKELGLRKNYVIEAALREKLEDLIDANDLKEAIDEAAGFHPLEDVKKDLRKKGKL